MPKLSTKLQSQYITINDFSGGWNCAVPQENLQDNELASAENFEYDVSTQLLKTCDGLALIGDTTINIDTFYKFGNSFIISSGSKLYKYDTTLQELATLTGANPARFCEFDKYLVIVSGGNIQYYDGTTVSTVNNSIPADFVFKKAGRLIIAKTTTDDILHFSTVGSITDWTEDTANDKSAKFLEVGYKDNCKISGITILGDELIVFKTSDTSNITYRVIGNYPNWQVKEIVRNQSLINSNSLVQADNNIFYISNSGLHDLHTVIEYGDIKTSNAGWKINKYLINKLSPSCKIWHIPTKKQIIIRPSNTNINIIFHYDIIDSVTQVKGAFTKRTTINPIQDIVDTGDNIYVATGTKIFKMDKYLYTEDSVQIKSFLRSKLFISNNEYIIKKASAEIINVQKGNAYVGIKKIILNFPYTSKSNKVFGNKNKVFGNHDKVLIKSNSLVTKRTNYREKSFDITLNVQKGALILRNIKLNIGEG